MFRLRKLILCEDSTAESSIIHPHENCVVSPFFLGPHTQRRRRHASPDLTIYFPCVVVFCFFPYMVLFLFFSSGHVDHFILFLLRPFHTPDNWKLQTTGFQQTTSCKKKKKKLPKNNYYRWRKFQLSSCFQNKTSCHELRLTKLFKKKNQLVD